MIDWRTLSQEEREKARDQVPGRAARKEKMDACIKETLRLLEGNLPATAKAWKLAWGTYLVNTPEEIAAHCQATVSCKLSVTFAGWDNMDRAVYRSDVGCLYVDTDPRKKQPPKMCTKYQNCFEGEPCDPVEAEFTFLPDRMVWD